MQRTPMTPCLCYCYYSSSFIFSIIFYYKHKKQQLLLYIDSVNFRKFLPRAHPPILIKNKWFFQSRNQCAEQMYFGKHNANKQTEKKIIIISKSTGKMFITQELIFFCFLLKKTCWIHSMSLDMMKTSSNKMSAWKKMKSIFHPHQQHQWTNSQIKHTHTHIIWSSKIGKERKIIIVKMNLLILPCNA